MPKCANCKVKFTPRFSSFQKVCEDPKCILWLREKEKQKEFKDWKTKTVEKNKTHSDFENELQPIINNIARLIDSGMPCISCDKMAKKPQGGHRFSVNSNNSLRFNLHNIGGQCFKCNEHLSGNPDGYDEGLKRVYGEEYYQYVRWEMKLAYPSVKLSKEELSEAKVIAKQIVKELEKLDMTYGAEVRVRMRTEYNKRIGIYTR